MKEYFIYLPSTGHPLEQGSRVFVDKVYLDDKRPVRHNRPALAGSINKISLYGFHVKSLKPKENYVGERSYSPPAY